MKRIFKIDERVWFEDDDMNGWGTIALVGGERRYPEYPVTDEVITIAKDEGGEIETTADRIYQLAPYTFQGEQCCWEFNETDDDYPLFCPEHYENCFFFECDIVDGPDIAGTAYGLMAAIGTIQDEMNHGGDAPTIGEINELYAAAVEINEYFDK